MNQYIVKKSIKIKAQPIKVWDALTNPEKTKEYFFHCEVFSGWNVGDTITFKGKMLFIIDIEMTGKILEIEPGKLLKYTLKNGKDKDAEAGYSTVTDVLTYENGETLVSITDDVGKGEGAQKRLEKSEEGWDKVLKGLKQWVENEQ
ncbi:MAG: SRPBCC domain-containing protein [Flavipsychrobacter sp.]|nr:SRPBCC domain-containing protein [Flavipsychrobacter sp.]